MKNKCSDAPKAEASYTPALVTVRLCKPAHCGDTAFTDKTGGCNNEASVWGRTYIDRPQGTWVYEK